MKNTLNCAECKFLKCYAIEKRIYYCNNEKRTDDMGKLGEILPVASPVWCPKRKEEEND